MREETGLERVSVAFDGQCATQHRIFTKWPIVQAARGNGFEITPIGDETVRLHLEINYSQRRSPGNIQGIPRSKLVLFALEPRAVLPSQHRRAVREKFGLVLVSSPDQLKTPTDVFFNYGLLGQSKSLPLELSRSHGSVAIMNANKSSWVSGSQYKTRKLFIKKLASLGFDVSIAGAGWGRSVRAELNDLARSLVFCISQGEAPDLTRFSWPINPQLSNSRFVGVIDDGNAFLQRHEFALVIENDLDYLSEKLFSALESGCIPLYLGPNLSKFGVPESIAIDLAKETEASLKLLMNDEVQKESIRIAGQSFITRADTREYWSHDAGLFRLFSTLRTYLH